MVDLVDELAHRQPLVLGLDDLQWADPASVLTLAALTHQLPHAPVLIVGCLRPTPRSSELTGALAVLGTAGAWELRLGPLPNQAGPGWWPTSSGHRPGPGCCPRWRSRWQPAVRHRAARALVREGCLHAVDARAEVSDQALPPSLRLTILRHSASCPTTPWRSCARPRCWVEPLRPGPDDDHGTVRARPGATLAPAIWQHPRRGRRPAAARH